MSETEVSAPAYVARARVKNLKPTVREVSVAGLEAPFRIGFHPELAGVYRMAEGSYETAPGTYDYLAGAVGGCLTGVLSAMLEANGIPSSDGRLTTETTAECEWEDRVLVVKRIHNHYVLHASADLDREKLAKAHDRHVSRCSMARSVGRCIEVTTSIEVVAE